ncbi:uncharacterized protein Z518_08396 [Rhinocladiella mackenziei CBS 650.93]|uniref:Uncharacterized protein n=1 Tax=Rhinocladiella mackenziei CBS 650.93 TaxID=1442369 RepID=A0A0D2J0P5_9EURO|nr:uncharacterized protein Z518_08396 [Rhinocladiella mackenziei CBS 650.93]KIX02455.1 hypothetical protein Z518_08396 [Rhinocladiella mackenziei CBS 650.93]
MNPSGNPVVQPQIELSNSALLATHFIKSVLRACAEEDVQPQSGLALERLGQKLFVSRQVIELGREVFKRKVEKVDIQKLKLVIGLSNDGLAKAMRESISLIKAFLLVVALKICFIDEEAGRLLHNMMWSEGIINEFPLYPDQVTQFITRVSGYGHSILPFEHFNGISSKVLSSLDTPDQIPALFERCDLDTLAQILTRIFDAFSNAEIVRISVEGSRTGLWLLAALSWLLPDETGCIVSGRLVLGKSNARLLICLKDQSEWEVAEWRSERQADSAIIRTEGLVPSLKYSPMSHSPLGSAKASISMQYNLKPEAADATGQLAAALIDVAFEKGVLCSVKCQSQSMLKDVCSKTFIEIHHTIVRQYGWDYGVESERTRTFRDKQCAVAKALIDWIPDTAVTPPALGSYHRQVTKAIDDLNINYFDRSGESLFPLKDSEFLKIIDPAIHVATEALLRSFSEEGCSARVFRPCHVSTVERGAELLYHLIFSPQIVNPYPYSKLRAMALESSLPGTHSVSPTDLAIAHNGYVAYLNVLENISTDKRSVSLIRTVPGTLKRAGPGVRDGGVCRSIEEVLSEDSLCGRELQNSLNPVNPFPTGQVYSGIEPQKDPYGIEAAHLFSFQNTRLRLNTVLQPVGMNHRRVLQPSPETLLQRQMNAYPYPASWTDSIEAIATAVHVFEHTLDTESERLLVEEWRRGGIFDKMVWHPSGKQASQFNNRITMTSSSEPLRFFEAGYLSQHGELIVRQGEIPLVSCLARATNPGSDKVWTIVA